MDIKITTRKYGFGHWEVTVTKNDVIDNMFQTTDSQLIDDIHEMNDDGNESELMTCFDFAELIEICLEK